MIEIGPAGIRANIEHYNAVILERSDHLNQAIEQMNYWLNQITKELHAQDNIQDHNSQR
jgi:hypothetical protein